MAKSNTKIIYNKEEDILYLSKRRASKASIEVGDFIIDVDFNSFVSAIEILNASENLNIDPDLLTKVDKASMSVIYRPNYLHLALILQFQNKEKEVVIPLTIDLGHKKLEKEEMVFVK